MLKRIICAVMVAVMVAVCAPIMRVTVSAAPVHMTQTIAAGYSHNLAIKEDGSLWSWGDDVRGAYNYGQFGRATTSTFGEPEQILDNIASVACGEFHSIVIKSDGTLWTFGCNDHGQLGDGTTTNRDKPVKILDNVSCAFSGGFSNSTFAIKTDGSLWAWGQNDEGQIGNGTKSDQHIPAKIMDAVSYVSSGAKHTLAIKNDGTLWAWGGSSYGVLGYSMDKSEDEYLSPKKIMNNVVNATARSDFASYSLAVTNDGSLLAWGGKFADLRNVNMLSELKIMDDVEFVAGASGKIAVLKKDKSLLVFPDGKINETVKSLDGVASVTTGGYRVVGLKFDGSLWACTTSDRESSRRDMYGIMLPKPIASSTATPSAQPTSATPAPSQSAPIYSYTTDPGSSVLPPYSNLATIKTESDATKVVSDYAQTLTTAQKRSPTGVDRMELFAEAALARVTTVQTNSGVIVDKSFVGKVSTMAQNAKNALTQTLIRNGISPIRDLKTSARFVITNKNQMPTPTPIPTPIPTPTPTSEPTHEPRHSDYMHLSFAGNNAKLVSLKSTPIVPITSLAISGVGFSKLAYSSDIKPKAVLLSKVDGATPRTSTPVIAAFTVGNDFSQIGVDSAIIAVDGAEIRLEKDKTTPGAYAVESQNASKMKVTFPSNSSTVMTVCFPDIGDSPYYTGMDADGKPLGGKPNHATGLFEVKANVSGVIEVKLNEKDFADIKSENAEVQAAIKTLASKGIITGRSATSYDPSATITRAEIATLLMGVLRQLDPNADGGFKDVARNDWFYGAAGSSKRANIINGYEDNTFRGNNIIPKDQIYAVSARILRTNERYYTPSDIGATLKVFSDAATIAEWAKADVALAEFAGLITPRTDGKFDSAEQMTRGNAAVAMLKLYGKIW